MFRKLFIIFLFGSITENVKTQKMVRTQVTQFCVHVDDTEEPQIPSPRNAQELEKDSIKETEGYSELQKDSQRQERIYSGIDVPNIHEMPSIVSITQYNKFLCAGVIIASNHVLSAFHCFMDPKNQTLRKDDLRSFKVYSETIHTWGGTAHDVKMLCPYPIYVSPIEKNPKFWEDGDLLVLKVHPPFRDDQITGIFENWPLQFTGPVDASIFGWGVYSGTNTLATRLQMANMTLVETGVCNTQHLDVLCAFPGPDNQQMCSGDSGGGVFLRESNTLLGIITYGAARDPTRNVWIRNRDICGDHLRVMFFTNATYHEDWIVRQIEVCHE